MAVKGVSEGHSLPFVGLKLEAKKRSSTQRLWRMRFPGGLLNTSRVRGKLLGKREDSPQTALSGTEDPKSRGRGIVINPDQGMLAVRLVLHSINKMTY